MPRVRVYNSGVRTARKIAEHAFKRGVTYVTLWAASEDNFKNRPDWVIKRITYLLKEELRRYIKKPGDMRIRVVGFWKGRINDPALDDLVEEVERVTESGSKHLTVLFCYDGEHDLRQAVLKADRAGCADEWELFLLVKDLPKVDLCIRTGMPEDRKPKETLEEESFRMSGFFLPGKFKGTILKFARTLWPDFTLQEFDKMLDTYRPMSRAVGA